MFSKFPNGEFLKPKSCKKCSTEFKPVSPGQLYCSKTCRGKNAYYVRNYGITQDELESMKKSQNYKCYICDSEGFIIGNNGHHEKLAVDHCHDSGSVRKLLCHNCNRALGLMQDSPNLLRKAADYIEEHKEGATTRSKDRTLK
jgi:hypothetical protein